MLHLDGRKLLRARRNLGSTQAEIAAHLTWLPPCGQASHASQARISQIETGGISCVEELEATRLAAVLGVPLSGILADNSEGTEPALDFIAGHLAGAQDQLAQAVTRLDDVRSALAAGRQA
jgi:transcriptional regulator with XRE-family HTH domain